MTKNKIFRTAILGLTTAVSAGSFMGTAQAAIESWWYCSNVSGTSASATELSRVDLEDVSETAPLKEEMEEAWISVLTGRGVVVGTSGCYSFSTEADALQSRSDFIQANSATIVTF
ncbi:MAG: hypothetical protein AAF723_04525 [Pseudomonadota bacterium]